MVSYATVWWAIRSHGPRGHNRFNFGAGTKDATIYVLNMQPVIPINLTEDWNLITRIIMPIR